MKELTFSPHPNILDHFILYTSLLNPATPDMHVYLPLPAVARIPSLYQCHTTGVIGQESNGRLRILIRALISPFLVNW